MSQQQTSPQQSGQRKPKARGKAWAERRWLAWQAAMDEIRRDHKALDEHMALGAEHFNDFLTQRLEALLPVHEARLKARSKRPKRTKNRAK
ncbi:MAG: hypothetical protein KF774_10625 [Planctomyces sp.]|nr:hypothetical protein [Planctomyces sp.]